jgi:dipeptidyl aminopeptidase/acylaminoacyl peptidase
MAATWPLAPLLQTMFMPPFTSLRAGCSLLFLLASISAAAQTPARPAIGTFFQNAAFSGAEMSPNGRLVAFRVATKGSRATLGVLDLATMQAKPVAAVGEADIGEFRWVNDERLVFNVTDLRIAAADVETMPGLFAVDRDGSGFRQLVQTHGRHFLDDGNATRMLSWNTFLIDGIGKQDSNEVFVELYEGYGKNVDTIKRLQRLNTKTGTVQTIDTPDYSSYWLIDQGGVPRIAVTAIGKRRAMHYNDPATGKWRKLTEFNALDDATFTPEWVGPDGTLYVSAYMGKDKAAIYRYDLVNNKILPEPVLASNDFDVDASFLHNKDKLLGLRYQADGELTHWFDPATAAIQKAIDAALPNTSNRISFGQRSETPYVLVDAYSDVQPHLYLIYNSATGKLTKLGAQHADIDPAAMGIKDMVRYKARDGLDIPAYITVPAGSTKKNMPMVVLVHGGPYVRGGYWEWDNEVQFLASRGYVVLEPEFRGSTGFGSRHFRAGWKQWGLAMQNDIADGARWAIDQGIADPKRICIAGASYGGYATLMGLVNDPELFRCGINWAGVTDINLMYTVGWSDASKLQTQYGMPMLIGDPLTLAAQFKATSPLEQAARIKQPLLLAYGGIDERVPLVHGKKFYSAVKDGNPQVEWVVYDDEAHGFAKPENKIDFWTRVEKFLNKHIGTP